MISEQILSYFSTFPVMFLLLSSSVGCNERNSQEGLARTDDVLHVYSLINHYQCQRLCWYTKRCKRYSFNKKGSSERAGNCILHASETGQGGKRMEGWTVRSASTDGLSPDSSCFTRPCSDTSICIPGKRQTSTVCRQIPTGNKDRCASAPCQNEGTCTTEGNTYICTCPAGYSGTNCETDTDECASSPCQNGGSCKDLANAYACDCLPGFAGSNCETGVDECASTPCQNGGTCTDQANGFTCDCLQGYTGDHCQTDIDECATNPCQNGGTCIDQINGYKCNCPAGFTGEHCQTDTDECASNPCRNGGSCVDQVNTYTCQCSLGFTGSRCETDIDECASNPCQNGGSCKDLANGYMCNCTTGYTGSRCETGTWLESDCTDHCPWPYTTCVSGKCLCQPDLYFSFSQYACTAEICTTFHPTRYIRYDNQDFQFHDLFQGHDNNSETCKAECTRIQTCRAFVYMPKSTWDTFCFFKDASVVEFPEHLSYAESFQTYQRTCA